MATQLRVPNLDPYIYQPDGRGGRYMVTNWVGWCLAYVQTAFNSGWAGNDAQSTWNNRLSFKHPDWNLPSGVFVPIWFTGYGGLGHVAIYKDGEVWSTPIRASSTFVKYASIEALLQAYRNIGIGLTYVGWSEDIGGTKLIELDAQGDEKMAIKNPEFIKNMYRYVGGREATQEEINIHMSGTPESLLNGFIGGNDLEVVRLRSQLDSVKQALANEQAKPPKEVVKTITEVVKEYVDRPVETPFTDQDGMNWLRRKWQDFIARFKK